MKGDWSQERAERGQGQWGCFVGVPSASSFASLAHLAPRFEQVMLSESTYLLYLRAAHSVRAVNRTAEILVSPEAFNFQVAFSGINHTFDHSMSAKCLRKQRIPLSEGVKRGQDGRGGRKRRRKRRVGLAFLFCSFPPHPVPSILCKLERNTYSDTCTYFYDRCRCRKS